MNGGGMEYPMMANDAATQSSMFTYSLTCHEIAHTYFPFYTGINERKYAWIDEGMASFLPGDLMKEMGFTQQPLRFDVAQYLNAAGKESDLPLMTPSYQLRSGTYYMLSYAKSVIAFELLRDDMGDETFKKALKEFIHRWKGKHPTPFDLFFTFDDVAGEDHAWFWKPWFFDFGYPDLAIEQSSIKGKAGSVVIRKIGHLPIPIHLKVTLEGNKQKILHLPVSVWRAGNDTYEMKLKFDEDIRSVRLGDVEIPDVNAGNNGR
jgi:aminopeptidase N